MHARVPAAWVEDSSLSFTASGIPLVVAWFPRFILSLMLQLAAVAVASAAQFAAAYVACYTCIVLSAEWDSMLSGPLC
jgi:hypothetical protein